MPGSSPGMTTERAPSRHAALEPLADLLLRQIAADEDDAALALLALLPRALMIAVEDHVHALEHEALVVVLEGEDALAAQDARSHLLHEVLHPGKELVRVEQPVGPKRQRLHLLVVIVLEAAAVMMVVVVIMIVVMTVIMVVIAAAQKFRLDVEDAVEIEGVASEHLGQRDPAAL